MNYKAMIIIAFAFGIIFGSLITVSYAKKFQAQTERCKALFEKFNPGITNEL